MADALLALERQQAERSGAAVRNAALQIGAPVLTAANIWAGFTMVRVSIADAVALPSGISFGVRCIPQRLCYIS